MQGGQTTALKLSGLTIEAAGGKKIVEGIDFSLEPGEIGALIGESGSGKTTVGRAILRLLPAALRITQGSIRFADTDLVRADIDTLRNLRGRQIGAVFQEPMMSLNPSIPVGRQMEEALLLHERVSRKDARERGLAMLERLKIPDPIRCYQEYPGKFSGGMRQRFMLASVLLTRPSLLIADEPTTALDAIVRREIMEQMVELTQEMGTSVLLVSHDLGMVSQYARHATVLHQGKVVEQGDAREILLNPRTDYMRQFVSALPARPSSAVSIGGRPLAKVSGLEVKFPARRVRLFGPKREVHAVNGVSFDIAKGEVLAVVGESGSGKTTIGRAMLGLNPISSGDISYAGSGDREAAPGRKSAVQMIFQDSYASLDPQMTLEAIVAEPLRNQPGSSSQGRLERARDLLREVGLGEDFYRRYPHELSGGQRQRVGIARAVAGQPALVVADEPVSALDATVQRQVLNLLMRLKENYDLSYLFISHDLSVVEEIADRVIVMHRGHVVEMGSRDAIFDRPCHPYTHRLLQATPRIARLSKDRYALAANPSTQAVAPHGYDFFEPDRTDVTGRSEMVAVAEGHMVLCCPGAAA